MNAMGFCRLEFLLAWEGLVMGSWSASREHMVWVCLQRVWWSWGSRQRIIRAVAGLYHVRLGFLSHPLWLVLYVCTIQYHLLMLMRCLLHRGCANDFMSMV